MDVKSLNYSLLTSSNKELVNQILTIKRNINEIIHNRLYIKNFPSKLMESLCDLDEIKEFIKKTDIYKCLRPILNFSDLHFELKDFCNRILNSFMNNLRNDLFENFTELKKLKLNNAINVKNGDSKICFIQDIEMQLLADIADKAENLKNTNEDLDDLHECLVRTDTKYLNYIKRIEMNMFLESKRRTKTKRLEMSPEKKTNKSFSSEIEDEGEGEGDGIKNGKDRDTKRSQIMKEITHKDQDENIRNKKKKYNSENTGKIRKGGKPLDDSLNIKDIQNNLHDDSNMNLEEVIDKSAFLQQVNLIQRKVLRSSIESKKTVDRCFEFLSKSEYVMKPIKLGRKRPKMTSDSNGLNLEQESLDLQNETNDKRDLSDENCSDQNVNHVE